MLVRLWPRKNIRSLGRHGVSVIGIRIVFHAFYPVAVPGCYAHCRRRGGKTSRPGLIVSPLAPCYATDTIHYSLVFKVARSNIDEKPPEIP